MIISVTERGTYKRCRLQWHYSSDNGRNLQRIGVNAPALELGSLIHRALAHWLLEPTQQLPHLFLHHSAQRLEEIRTTYKQVVGCAPADSELSPIYESVELGNHMMENYQRKWKSPVPRGMTYAAAEQEIAVPVPGTEHQCPSCIQILEAEPISHTHTFPAITYHVTGVSYRSSPSCTLCNGAGFLLHQLRATLDGLLQDKKDRLFILEHKTYSRTPSLATLNTTDQFTGYAWIVTQLNMAPLGGIAYDGMLKSKAPPRGKTFDDLFLRLPILKSPEEIQIWGANLAQELNEMATPSLPLYPNRPWQGCFDCSFQEPCTARAKGEDEEHILKTMYTTRDTKRVQGVRDSNVVEA